jgi:hypothetical protein
MPAPAQTTAARKGLLQRYASPETVSSPRRSDWLGGSGSIATRFEFDTDTDSEGHDSTV